MKKYRKCPALNSPSSIRFRSTGVSQIWPRVQPSDGFHRPPPHRPHPLLLLLLLILLPAKPRPGAMLAWMGRARFAYRCNYTQWDTENQRCCGPPIEINDAPPSVSFVLQTSGQRSCATCAHLSAPLYASLAHSALTFGEFSPKMGKFRHFGETMGNLGKLNCYLMAKKFST